MKRAYLEKMPLAQAQARWFSALEQAGCFDARSETIPTAEAFERITAVAVHALRPVPHVRAAAMDGIAVRADQTAGARLDQPLVLRKDVDFVQVDTGDPISQGFDAVIMLEDLDFPSPGTAECRKAAFPGQNVRPVGEDFPKGQTILPARTRLSPEAIAACLGSGNLALEVIRRPKVFVLPTGAELVSPLEPIPAGKYPETNTALFAGYLKRWQALPTMHPLLEDDYAQIRRAIESSLQEHDLLLVNAGTSKGREDFTTSIIEELGQLIVHGVSMHPGHPLVLGLAQGKPIVGVPGYPVATWVVLDQFVLPFLERYYGCALQPRTTVVARLARRVHSPLGEVEFVRVRLEQTEEGWIAHPLAGKASTLSSLIHADGLLVVPEELGGCAQGELVEVRLLK